MHMAAERQWESCLNMLITNGTIVNIKNNVSVLCTFLIRYGAVYILRTIKIDILMSHHTNST